VGAGFHPSLTFLSPFYNPSPSAFSEFCPPPSSCVVPPFAQQILAMELLVSFHTTGSTRPQSMFFSSEFPFNPSRVCRYRVGPLFPLPSHSTGRSRAHRRYLPCFWATRFSCLRTTVSFFCLNRESGNGGLAFSPEFVFPDERDR